MTKGFTDKVNKTSLIFIFIIIFFFENQSYCFENTNTFALENSNSFENFENLEFKLNDLENILVLYTSSDFFNKNCKISDSERDTLVDELHYCFRNAKDAILESKRAIENIKNIDVKQTSKRAVEACLAGFIASRSGLGALTASFVAVLCDLQVSVMMIFMMLLVMLKMHITGAIVLMTFIIELSVVNSEFLKLVNMYIPISVNP